MYALLNIYFAEILNIKKINIKLISFFLFRYFFVMVGGELDLDFQLLSVFY